MRRFTLHIYNNVSRVGFSVSDEMIHGEHVNLEVHSRLNLSRPQFDDLIEFLSSYKKSLKNVILNNFEHLNANEIIEWKIEEFFEVLDEISTLTLSSCRFEVLSNVEMKNLKSLKVENFDEVRNYWKFSVETSILAKSISNFLTKCPKLENLLIKKQEIDFTSDFFSFQLKKLQMESCKVKNFKQLLISQKNFLEDIEIKDQNLIEEDLGIIFDSLRCKKISLSSIEIGEVSENLNFCLKELKMCGVEVNMEKLMKIIRKFPSEYKNVLIQN